MDPHAIDTTAEMTDRADQAALDAFDADTRKPRRKPEYNLDPWAVTVLAILDARDQFRVVGLPQSPVGASDPPTLPEGP